MADEPRIVEAVATGAGGGGTGRTPTAKQLEDVLVNVIREAEKQAEQVWSSEQSLEERQRQVAELMAPERIRLLQQKAKEDLKVQVAGGSEASGAPGVPEAPQ
jgi:hypothetical protein